MARTASFWRSGVFIWGITWFLTYVGVRAVVERPEALSTPVLVVLVLTPVIPLALFLFYLITGMREMDELERGFSSRRSRSPTRSRCCYS